MTEAKPSQTSPARKWTEQADEVFLMTPHCFFIRYAVRRQNAAQHGRCFKSGQLRQPRPILGAHQLITMIPSQHSFQAPLI